MAEVVTRICDSCAGPDAKRIAVSSIDWGDWELDMCDTCLAPLLALRPREGHRFRKIPLPPQP